MANQLIQPPELSIKYFRKLAEVTIAFNHFLYPTNNALREEYDVHGCKTCLRNYFGALETKILGYAENHPETKSNANYFLNRLNNIKGLDRKTQLKELEKIPILNFG